MALIKTTYVLPYFSRALPDARHHCRNRMACESQTYLGRRQNTSMDLRLQRATLTDQGRICHLAPDHSRLSL